MRRGLLAPLTALVTGAAVLPLFAVSARRASGPGVGLPLDDAWIHIRFAMNLAAGHGFAFNPGEPLAGSTSPLWVVILAALRRLMAGEPAALSASASAVSYLLACVLAALLAERLALWAFQGDGQGPVPAALAGAGAGALTALCGRFAWSALSGMEVALFAALTLAAALSYLGPAREEGAGRAWPLLAGLALLARPEGALFLLAGLGLILLRHRDRGEPWGPMLLRPLAVALAPVLPWILFCLWSGGSPLPSTFTPNRGGLAFPDGRFVASTVRQLVVDNPVAAALAAAGLLALAWGVAAGRRDPRQLLPVAWVAAFPLAAAIIAPNLRHHGRYNMPLIPMVSVLAAVGAVAAARLLARHLGVRWIAGQGGGGQPATPWRAAVPLAAAALLLAAALLGAASGLQAWSRTFAWDVQNIRAQHEQVGRWLADRAGPGCHVPTHDIGAMGVLSGCVVTDLIGLVTPEVARLFRDEPDPDRRDPRIRVLLQERGITHVAIYPGWFPALAGDPALRPVFEARVEVRSSAGASRMVVYRTPAPGPW